MSDHTFTAPDGSVHCSCGLGRVDEYKEATDAAMNYSDGRADALDEVRAAIDADPYPSDAHVARRILRAILAGTER